MLRSFTVTVTGSIDMGTTSTSASSVITPADNPRMDARIDTLATQLLKRLNEVNDHRTQIASLKANIISPKQHERAARRTTVRGRALEQRTGGFRKPLFRTRLLRTRLIFVGAIWHRVFGLALGSGRVASGRGAGISKGRQTGGLGAQKQ
jgi:hypothetical protein